MENTKEYTCVRMLALVCVYVHICYLSLPCTIYMHAYIYIYIHARLYISILRLFRLFFNRENRNACRTTTPV